MNKSSNNSIEDLKFSFCTTRSSISLCKIWIYRSCACMNKIVNDHLKTTQRKGTMFISSKTSSDLGLGLYICQIYLLYSCGLYITYIRNFAWEDQSKKTIHICHMELLTRNSSILSSYRTRNWQTVLYGVVIERLWKFRGDFITNDSQHKLLVLSWLATGHNDSSV